MARFIDSHCHLNSPELREDIDKHLTEADSASVFRIMLVGCDLLSSREALDIIRSNPDRGLYGAVGIHPHEAQASGGLSGELREMASEEKVLAVGEIGLDFYYDHSPKKVQYKVMAEQIEWANEMSLPIIFHVRDAFQDFFSILRDVPVGEAGAVVHCYSGSWREAVTSLDLGFYLGFGGMLTFKKADEVREIFRKVPLERVLLETDSPWLAPVPYRGKTNRPSLVPLIYEKAAEVKELPLDSIASTVWKNGVDFYGWSDVDV